jgi:hypothetical protein
MAKSFHQIKRESQKGGTRGHRQPKERGVAQENFGSWTSFSLTAHHFFKKCL